ncbi:MAG: hypothetical protein R2939_11370 [Kofleriaceae bacterium]
MVAALAGASRWLLRSRRRGHAAPAEAGRADRAGHGERAAEQRVSTPQVRMRTMPVRPTTQERGGAEADHRWRVGRGASVQQHEVGRPTPAWITRRR